MSSVISTSAYYYAKQIIYNNCVSKPSYLNTWKKDLLSSKYYELFFGSDWMNIVNASKLSKKTFTKLAQFFEIHQM